jgi:hypothetical protein
LIIEGDGWCLKPGLQREAMEREYRSFLNYIKDPEEGIRAVGVELTEAACHTARRSA